MDRLHIDANIRASTGKEAAALLAVENDAAHIGASGGIEQVDEGRWRVAQECERRHWFAAERATADDHNYLNYLDFAGYQVLTGLRFERVIELGCGPFTNLRYIARRCDISTVELLDPLIGDYLQHRNRYFDEHALYAAPLWGRYNAVHKRAPWIWRALASRAGRSVPISALHPVALEDFDPPNQYDLVVIINVLEHCRDLTAIFTAVRAMIAAGGILVFADVGFDGSELREVGHRQWDAAHPLRPLTATIDEFLSDFEPLFDLRRPYTAGLYKRCMFRNFVGRAS